MAYFQCLHCDHEAHFVDFKVAGDGDSGAAEDLDVDGDEDGGEDEDKLECPECGAQSGICEM
jgi:hypothetical protein